MAQGFARLTSTTQQFLDRCPAVESWTTTADGHFVVFEFDRAIEVPVVPPGIYFDADRASDDERVALANSLLHSEIDRLDESDLQGTREEREALHEVLAQEGFGGREDAAIDFDTARRVAVERLAWLRGQRAEGHR